MSEWRVHGVDHLALVNAYYAGAVRVCETTLQPPQEPFFRGASTDSGRGRKKRKRQQQNLESLIASGKFVPVDPEVVKALQRAHAIVLQGDEWKPHFVGEIRGIKEDNNDHDPVLLVSTNAHANASDSLVRIVYNDNVCWMPRRSQFLIGDVRMTLVTDAKTLNTFTFILMDPPWENKSVDRKRCYSTLDHRDLLQLPMQQLASCKEEEGCVLALWVTNRPTYMTFILEELLPHWGFTYHATWYWLKVCTTGELVSPLASPHRLPFEKLVVATYAASPTTHERLRGQLANTPKVVVSVPLRHSWKPPPESFFSVDILSKRNLEVFARELRPQFTSVGNEPLKFQTHAHFNKMGTVDTT